MDKVTNHSIIVVDDDPIIRMDIREILEEEGYFVGGEAKNGEEAIELAARVKPDLAIMDVKMPVMNGIKAARIIRNMQDTAVLLLTAYSQRELVRDARDAGVTAYLVKPVAEEDLIPAVEIALSQKERLDAMKQNVLQLKQSIEDRKTIERAKGRIMKTLRMEEEEAYALLRNASMNRGTTLAKVAEMVIAKGPEWISPLAEKEERR